MKETMIILFGLIAGFIVGFTICNLFNKAAMLDHQTNTSINQHP